MRIRTDAVVCAVALLGLTGGVIIAGDLEPPAGSPAPTMKTLDEIEPRTPVTPETTPGDAFSVFKITLPGSYYLTSDVVGESGKHGVWIEANDVSLDLNGFSLIGVPGTLDGVTLIGALEGVSIVNGVIRNWGERGVDGKVGAASAAQVRLERLRVFDNAFQGLMIEFEAMVSDCLLHNNGSHGLEAGRGSTITNTSVESSDLAGFFVGDRSVLRGCVSRSNGGAGFDVAAGAILEDCVAADNSAYGVQAGDGATIRGCTVSQNSGGGVFLEQDSLVESCAISGNVSTTVDTAGVSANGEGSRIVNNTISGHVGLSGTTATAVELNTGYVVVDGNTIMNNDVGVDVACGCTVVRNTLGDNATALDTGLICGTLGLPPSPVIGASTTNAATAGPWDNFVY